MNTLFALMAEFNTAEIPLEKVCEKFFGLSERKAKQRASTHELPVPAYRGGSQKSPWLVNVQDLANYIDNCREKARLDWEKLNGKLFQILLLMYGSWWLFAQP